MLEVMVGSGVLLLMVALYCNRSLRFTQPQHLPKLEDGIALASRGMISKNSTRGVVLRERKSL